MLNEDNCGAVVSPRVSTVHVRDVSFVFPASSATRMVRVKEFAPAGTGKRVTVMFVPSRSQKRCSLIQIFNGRQASGRTGFGSEATARNVINAWSSTALLAGDVMYTTGGVRSTTTTLLTFGPCGWP